MPVGVGTGFLGFMLLEVIIPRGRSRKQKLIIISHSVVFMHNEYLQEKTKISVYF